MKLNKKTIILSVLATSVFAQLSPNIVFADPVKKIILTRNSAKIYSDSLSASYALHFGDIRFASQAFENVWKRDKTNEIAFEKALFVYLLMGNINDALRLSNDADFKESVNSNYLKAIDYASNNDFSRVGEILQKSEASGSKGLYIRHMKAWSLLADKKLDEAITIASKPSGKNAIDLYANYSRALMYEYAGDYANAEIAYENSFNSIDYDVYAILTYTNFLKAIGKKDKALEILKNSEGKTQFNNLIDEAIQNINIKPKLKKYNSSVLKEYMSSSLTLIAGAELLNNSGTGLADMHLAYKLNPKNSYAALIVAENFISLKNTKDAISLLKTIPKNSSIGDNANALLIEVTGIEDKALSLKLAEESVSLRPNIVNLQNLAYALLRNKDYEKSEAIFSKIIDAKEKQSGRNDLWLMYYSRGNMRLLSKKIEDSISDYRKANELNPDNAEILNSLGYTQVDNNLNLEESLSLLRTAAALDGQKGHIIDSLGWALYKLGKFEEALDYLESAASLDPNNPEIIDHLGDAYWKTGRKDEAIIEWRKSIKIQENIEVKNKINLKIENGLKSESKSNS